MDEDGPVPDVLAAAILVYCLPCILYPLYQLVVVVASRRRRFAEEEALGPSSSREAAVRLWVCFSPSCSQRSPASRSPALPLLGPLCVPELRLLASVSATPTRGPAPFHLLSTPAVSHSTSINLQQRAPRLTHYNALVSPPQTHCHLVPLHLSLHRLRRHPHPRSPNLAHGGYRESEQEHAPNARDWVNESHQCVVCCGERRGEGAEAFSGAAATVLGAMMALTAVIGVIGFSLGLGAGKGDNTTGLVAFNWALIITSASFVAGVPREGTD